MTKDNNKILKAPISFEQFSKDPVKGLLFITLIVIGYLYIDGKYIDFIKGKTYFNASCIAIFKAVDNVVC